MAKHQIKMRIICRDPIRVCLGYEAIEFGLQDKKQSLQKGKALSADEIAFEFALNVEQQSDGTTSFTGPFAHDTRVSRFVYLTYKGYDGESWQIYRRIKVSLSRITRSQVEAALRDDTVLQARVSGLFSGTVPLTDGGWVLVN